MRTVKLYGHLGKRFGRTHKFDVRSPAEAVRALTANFPDFRQALVEHTPGYHVHVGDEIIGQELLGFGGSAPIKFVPVVAGAKAGLGQIILGTILIVAGTLGEPLFGPVVSAYLINAGIGMIIGGVAQMLIGAPKSPGAQNGPLNSPNYAFNGPINTIAQGNSVPVCYGRLIVGSQVISANLSVEQTTGRVTPPTPGLLP